MLVYYRYKYNLFIDNRHKSLNLAFMEHIAEKIKQYLAQNKISVIEFAKKINRSF